MHGEIELIKKSCRKSSAVCISKNCEVLEISQQYYLENILCDHSVKFKLVN